MKVYSISVLTEGKPAECRAAAHDVSSYGFFQQGSMREFLVFTSKTLAERTPAGQRQSVEQDEYNMHVHAYNRRDGLVGVVVTDKEYPVRVAFSLLNKVLDDFTQKFPKAEWTQLTAATSQSRFPELQATLTKFQDPHSADSLLKVQRELDETKIILHKTIESVLERGEKLDDLVAKSDQLSMQSKTFYKTAQKTNSCCRLM
ncbi:palmitoyltransferase [Sorochytrium milnesiophthora]